ncbi:murein transglycosylase [Idiomarina sp. WRN-38]|uniref:membrane-bound lytic murein transglycosylase MltF n=1 Tax=unclassified Idiomarina TaxID=2614829 RepID=UPI00073341EC|nr:MULTISPECIES: membrane-bound lytic murein transglycosylase MltF [unclassified Idiomarina]KTG29978.1 murein transglycosylase [Idiomarina sp. H105]OAF14372.1 murein transglycosylase [Idiomarina sp. WRN-38]MCJ8317775.1 membrane-bound lytic murein transglycosylase MltF [Idiomarina sp.]NQZ17448.1 membrane-bound lytic murein transglycosylase MltF [Idiomarina sp.]WPZ01848.1 membrane-bound lytic murein transglycosylase MltF [Idiomarina sp. OXR-189]
MPKSAVYFLVTVFLAVTTLTACTPQTRPNAMTVVQERQVLRVGTLMNPTSYYFDHDREQGFEYDLAKRFADRLGVELEMVPRFDVNDLFTMLRRGEVDIVAAGIDRTSTRSQLFRFSPPYDVISQKVVFKQGSRQRPRDLQQITDGEIVVVEGSSHHEFLKSLGDSIPTLKWRATSDHDAVELLRMVINEEIDYTITDSTALDIQRRFHPDLSVAFTVKHDQDIGWALPQSDDDSLYAAVIEYFGEIRSSGRLAHIKEQHFGHVKQFNYVTTSLFIEAVDTILPKYKNLFREHSGTLDWRLLAAISYQESLWNPRAVSPTGVRGMMMLTLPTAKAMGVKSRLNAEQSIRGGARYLERMLERVPDRIPQPDRTWFALAAYNIGFGHLEDARILTEKQGGNPDRWVDVKKRLPLLRQKQFYRQTRFGFARGDEPVTYVGNIRRFYDTLKYLDEQGRL